MGNRAKVSPCGQLEFGRQLGNSSHAPGFDPADQIAPFAKGLKRQAATNGLALLAHGLLSNRVDTHKPTGRRGGKWQI